MNLISSLSLGISSFQNLDLLSVGITVSAIGILGFAIYFSNRKSITNKSFLFLAIMTMIWGTSNYFEYKFITPESILWALRVHLFISVVHALTFFQLAYVFPSEKTTFPKWYKFILVPVTGITALLTLTPFVFTRVLTVAPPGYVTNPERGPGIALFAIVAFGLLLSGLVVLLRKTLKVKGAEKKQAGFMFAGMFIMAILILLFNVVLPITFNDLSFIPLGAIFVFPFIALTGYAVFRQKLFNIKDAATVIVAFALTIVSFAEIIFANTLSLVIFRVSVFILVLIFSIRMVRDMFQLEFANDRLKELDQMKSEFVSLATHQIRAPLTAIKGYISLIQEGDYGEVTPEIRKGLNVIMDSTNNLVTIVGDFLDVSRIEQGKMKFDFSDFNLKKLVEEVVQEYRPNIEKRGLVLDFSCDEQARYDVHADRGKVKQVIGNILDNSIKYTPKGKISVSVKNQDGKVLITIADTGVGINPKTLPKLFQKFTRADNANETNILGTGLGLYVAKNMIESMNGRVWAESEGEGKGSQFHIEMGVKA
jgi:signal transduction histidine kinase